VSFSVAVVAVGDELLLGDVVNGNLAWLGRTLAEAGVPVVRAYEVGDDVEILTATLRSALASADAVVVTGGLGPTSDDRTRDAVARVMGVAVVRDVGLLADLDRWYADRGRQAPPTVAVQADVPAGARSLRNAVGTAPGLAAEVGGRLLVAVPGVPAEMRPMVRDQVVPELRRRAGEPAALVTRQLRVAVLGESLVATRLAPLEESLPAGVQLAYLASPGEVRVRFTGTDPDAAAGALARARDLLGDAVSGTDGETLAATVLRLAGGMSRTVGVAESLTGGSVAAALVDVAGASLVLRGAVVAYATDLKAELLGVDRDLLDREGAVHPLVAEQMARGVARRAGADYGIATTGVAGPDPQDGLLPGTVHVAVVGPGRAARVDSPVLRGDRGTIRALSVVHALDLWRRVLLADAGGEEQS
jgi:nicotinamide-nucleotide amidase